MIIHCLKMLSQDIQNKYPKLAILLDNIALKMIDEEYCDEDMDFYLKNIDKLFENESKQ